MQQFFSSTSRKFAKVVGGLTAAPMQTFLLCRQFAYETATLLLDNNPFRGKI